MTPAQREVIDALRDEGYAVTVFAPEELRDADPDQVQDKMVERGWQAIEWLAGPVGEEQG